MVEVKPLVLSQYGEPQQLQSDDALVFPHIPDCPDDETAASVGVPLRGLYHTDGILRIRLV